MKRTVIVLAGYLASAIGAQAAGIPEPGFTMYGVIRNDIGGATVRMTSGTMTWTVVPQSGPPVTTTVNLTNINDQFSYVIDIPFETAIAGVPPTSNALQMAASLRTFNRGEVRIGTNLATVVAPAGTTFSFSQANRSDMERVDLVVTARDPDSDNDGIPDWWETLYFGCATCATAGDDPDFDGLSNLEEYLAGTNPLDPNSFLRFMDTSRMANGQMEIRWASELGRYYRISRSTSLLGTFSPIATEISATPPTNLYIDDVGTNVVFFYRIDLE